MNEQLKTMIEESSSFDISAPVGLFGLLMQISFVSFLTKALSSSRSGRYVLSCLRCMISTSAPIDAGME